MDMEVKLHKRLYNLKEAAGYLGRTVGAVRGMLWAGKMSYVRDGKRILLDIGDMDEWIEKSKAKYNNKSSLLHE
jgi:excisionase family DNA binding protein